LAHLSSGFWNQTSTKFQILGDRKADEPKKMTAKTLRFFSPGTEFNRSKSPPAYRFASTMFLRPSSLYRAFFCAVGLVMIIVGLECLAIESALFAPGVFEDTNVAAQQNPWLNTPRENLPTQRLVPLVALGRR
jgi:hypothetical protein